VHSKQLSDQSSLGLQRSENIVDCLYLFNGPAIINKHATGNGMEQSLESPVINKFGFHHPRKRVGN